VISNIKIFIPFLSHTFLPQKKTASSRSGLSGEQGYVQHVAAVIEWHFAQKGVVGSALSAAQGALK
jgi:hypothetical protein